MKIQIVYALIASDNDLFIQEIWSSIYSVRQYEPDRDIRIVCDVPTANLIDKYEGMKKLVTEVVTVNLENKYDTPKLQSRQLKTTIREHISGPFLFIDTDTIISGKLDYIDTLTCDIAAALEYHIPLSQSPFRQGVHDNMKRVFDLDVTGQDAWHNSGVIYCADNERTHKFYKQWNANWNYSAFEKGMSQDEPALMKTDADFGYIIQELPGEYNCQPCMSMEYFADAKIIHFLHMHFPKDKSFCSFMDKSIYKKIKDECYVTEEIAEEIKNVKASFDSPSTVVGWSTMNFIQSPVFPIFEKIYKEGGAASWLMLKVARWLEWLHKYTKKR